MARRFTGPFSPRAAQEAVQDATTDGPALRPRLTPKPRAGLRSYLLFLLAFPFLARAFFGTDSFFPAISAAGLMIAAAWFTRQGRLAEETYAARSIARRPAFPRKTFGSLFTGLAFAAGAAAWETRPMALAALGLIAAGLHFASFGPDPMRDKRPTTTAADPFQTERAAKLIAEAETLLIALEAEAARSRSRSLIAQTESFAATARSLFLQLEADPGAVASLRAYLTAYLQGARDAVAKLADLLAQAPNPRAEEDTRALIADLDTAFTQRRQKLIAHDQTGLDIEIDVLRERLKLNA
jgi:hypothetical protein